jgi:hypothetical protein
MLLYSTSLWGYFIVFFVLWLVNRERILLLDAAVVRITDAQRRATCLVEFNIIKYVKVFTSTVLVAVCRARREMENSVFCRCVKFESYCISILSIQHSTLFIYFLYTFA